MSAAMVQNEKMRRMLPFLLSAVLLPGPAPAQDRHRHRHLDHDSARAAVMEGRVLPLAEILAMVQPRGWRPASSRWSWRSMTAC